MSARKDSSAKPYVDNYVQLKEWLESVDGRCMWQKMDRAMSVEGWLIKGVLVVIVVNANGHGWDIYTSSGQLSVEKTLADANKRIAGKD